ncbi:MAG: FAD binding domain-containing protein [Anaerolineales bacterium]|jgi:CO/xanthine dehydrogenase FAD-binding subunit
MITQYYRPQTLEEALKLLSQPDTFPLGGGTALTQRRDESFSVVDLQALSLDKLHKSGDNLEIGATVTLQNLLESPYTSNALKTAIELEAPLNLRTMGTVAGTVVTCDGRSSFGAVILALDAKCTLVNDMSSAIISLGNLLPLRGELLHSKLITCIEIPLNVKLAIETVARTPLDKPIVCVALAQWPSGRTRLALGGWGQTPTLAMDGNESSGLQEAARNAAYEAADEWASAEYRREIAGVLARRCLEK